MLLVSLALCVVFVGGLIAFWRPAIKDTTQRLPATSPDRPPPSLPTEGTPVPTVTELAQPRTPTVQPPTQSPPPGPPPMEAKPEQPKALKAEDAAKAEADTERAWQYLFAERYQDAEREATKVVDFLKSLNVSESLRVSKSLSALVCRARAREQLYTDDLEPAESDVKAVEDATGAERKSLMEDKLLHFYHVAADLKKLRGERAARESDVKAAQEHLLAALRYYDLAVKLRPQLRPELRPRLGDLQESCRDVRKKIDALPPF